MKDEQRHTIMIRVASHLLSTPRPSFSSFPQKVFGCGPLHRIAVHYGKREVGRAKERLAVESSSRERVPPLRALKPNRYVSVVPGGIDSESVSELEEAHLEFQAGLNAVVKVFCKHTEPNFSLPWQRKRQYSSSSSGFMVSQGSKRWVLTNAHSVSYYSQVQLKRRDKDRKFIATVLAIGTDCDIALLTVEESEFWEGIDPLSLGPLPNLQDCVTVVGYPVGGDTISVTSGVVSRVEVTQYAHGSCDLLGVQIDAAINSGNSGGPVFDDHGVCVGIAFQSFAGSDVENIGYVVPTPVIEHFLTDYKRNQAFTGFPTLGIQWQKLESVDLRRASGMASDQSGILIRAINPTSGSQGVLMPGDVLVQFEGVNLANDGTVPFRTDERISFTYLVAQKYVGDEASVTILRNGTPQTFKIKLTRLENLVPAHLDNRPPSYFILAGFVFTPLNEPYLISEYGADYDTDSPVKLLNCLFFGRPKQSGDQVVILSQVLACESTVGYEDLENVQVLRFNNEQIHDLKQLVRMIAECKTEYMRFDLEYELVVVISSKSAHASTTDVLEEHAIPSIASPDILPLVDGK